MKKLVLLIFSTVSLVFSQSNIAIIDDEDGFTNVREGKGLEYPIVGKIYDNEVFYYDSTEGEKWWKINTAGLDKSLKGYIYHNRIRPIGNLSKSEKKNLFNIIFEKEKELAQNFLSSNYSYNSRRELERHHSANFDPILDSFSEYVCEFKNEELFRLFLDPLILNESSADELPAVALAEIFACHTEWAERIISSISTKFLVGELKFGVMNIINENDPKYKILMNSINELYKNAKN